MMTSLVISASPVTLSTPGLNLIFQNNMNLGVFRGLFRKNSLVEKFPRFFFSLFRFFQTRPSAPSQSRRPRLPLPSRPASSLSCYRSFRPAALSSFTAPAPMRDSHGSSCLPATVTLSPRPTRCGVNLRKASAHPLHLTCFLLNLLANFPICGTRSAHRPSWPNTRNLSIYVSYIPAALVHHHARTSVFPALHATFLCMCVFDTTCMCVQISARKPEWSIGASAAIAPAASIASRVAPAATVAVVAATAGSAKAKWSLSSDDLQEADMIDEDALLAREQAKL